MPEHSFLYSIPYFLFFVYLSGFLYLEIKYRQDRKIFFSIRYFTVFGLIFFLACRGLVSSDWVSYYPFFEELPTLGNGWTAITEYAKKSFFENGFCIYSSLVKSIFPSYYFWVFVSTTIDIIILDFFFKKKSKYYVLSFILFFAFGGLLMELNLYRNMKSFVLFLISLHYVHERRFIPYFLLNLLGILFHTTSILYILLYPFWNTRFFIRFSVPIFIIGNIIFLFRIEYFNSFLTFFNGVFSSDLQRFFRYLNNPEQYKISIGYLERIITYILVIKMAPRLLLNKENIVYINAFIFYFISFFFLAEIGVAVERITLLFAFSYWILYPELLSLATLSRNKKKYLALILTLCMMKNLLANNGFISYYENVFFEASTFLERYAWYQNMGRW